MKTVTIDFSKAKYFMDVHYIIKESFQRDVEGFPDFYGNNLDALWDCMWGFIEKPVRIIVTGIDNLNSETAGEVAEVIEVIERAVNDDYDWGIEFEVIRGKSVE